MGLLLGSTVWAAVIAFVSSGLHWQQSKPLPVIANWRDLPASDQVSFGVKWSVLQEADRRELRKKGLPQAPPFVLKVEAVILASPVHRKGSLIQGDLLVPYSEGRPIRNEKDFQEWIGAIRRPAVETFERFRPGRSPRGQPMWNKEQIDIMGYPEQRMRDEVIRRSYLFRDGKWQALPRLPMFFDSYARREVGGAGKLGRFEVRQVLGDSEMLIGFPRSTLGAKLSGFSTKEFLDGVEYSGDAIRVAYIDTWSYETVSGGSRTVLLAVPLSDIEVGLDDMELATVKKLLDIDDAEQATQGLEEGSQAR